MILEHGTKEVWINTGKELIPRFSSPVQASPKKTIEKLPVEKSGPALDITCDVYDAITSNRPYQEGWV
jgi:hypothetical protein